MVARILEVPISDLHVRTRRSEDMILTFRERQVRATGRRAFGLAGPKRTAEQYLMVFILCRTSEEDLLACEEG
jgi:hypothetical protein